MTRAERKVLRLARGFPTLFGTNEHARMKALTHIFCVNGCGFKWHHGEVLSVEELCGIKERPRREWDERKRDHGAVREANDHVPHLVSNFSLEYSLLGTLPPDAKPAWRALAFEVLDYYLTASQWSFLKYDGIQCVFSPQQEWDMKEKLRKLDAKLRGKTAKP